MKRIIHVRCSDDVYEKIANIQDIDQCMFCNQWYTIEELSYVDSRKGTRHCRDCTFHAANYKKGGK